MSLIFKPSGALNIAVDPSSLPEEGTGSTIFSTSMQRCKNLSLDDQGKAVLRSGSNKFNTSALTNTSINRIIVQGGVRYSFAGTAIYKSESSIATGLTDSPWSGMMYNSFNSTTQNIFALNGTDRKRIEGSNVYEWGIEPPTAAPTIAVGASTGLTGDYNVKYTYARLEGTTVVSESNPSSAAISAVTLSDESLSISWTASSDPQVTHVRLYRTLAGGSTYQFLQSVAIGTTSVDDATSDAALGAAVETDHNRPPLGTFVFGPTYNGISFILKDNLLYFSDAKVPEYWPLANFIEVSTPQFPLQTGVFHGGQPYVFSKKKIHFIQGTGVNTFFPLEMDSLTGSQSIDGAVAVRGHGIFHTGPDGIYLWSEMDRKFTKNTFDPIFRGETVNGIPGVSDMSTSWLAEWHGKIYFGYASSGFTYPNNILVFDLEDNRPEYYNYNDNEIRSVASDKTNNYFVGGDNSGFLWRLENGAKTQDGSTDISWDVQSKDFTLSTRKHFPRWIKYDVNASLATAATGSLILDGTEHQTHILSGNRQTKRRLVATGNGDRVSMRIQGSGPIEIYTLEGE